MEFIKNINWHDFITTKFWFEVDRARIHPSEQAFLYIGIGLVVLGVLALVFARFTHNKFLARVAMWLAKIFLTIGILEGIWYLMRTQYAQLLGSKFVAALLLLWGIIWIYWPIRYLLKNYQEDMVKAEREASREKYLNLKRR